jgi:diguanylate cyclase (GGDEF)-like protein/PAS domain S-box-containing protein
MDGLLQFVNKISIISISRMDSKSSKEFKEKYIKIILQRGALFNMMVLVNCFYGFYVDYSLYKITSVDMLYKKTLIAIHGITFILAFIYILVFKFLEKKESNIFFEISKVVILTEVFLAVFLAAITSLNSQRFSGNIDIYILTVLLVAFIVPVFPKMLIGIYSLNHAFFIIGLTVFCKDKDKMIIYQVNSTITLLVALVFFIVMYRYNVTNFLNNERLREDRLIFRKLFEMNPFPLLIFGFDDGKIQDVNQKALGFYEIKKEQVDSYRHEELFRNTSDLDEMLKTLNEKGQVHNYVVEHRKITGETTWVIVNYEIIDYFGKKSILSGVADITEIKKIEDELIKHASIDVLTGVLNRRVGMDIIRKKLEASKKEKEEFSLCFLDIDKLKTVNDEFGHKEGDALITEVCKVVKEQINPKDIVFRYGGDEFIILFDNKRNHEIDRTCERIKNRFIELNKNSYKPYAINASLGVFSYKPELDLTIEQIIGLADKEMYKKKI